VSRRSERLAAEIRDALSLLISRSLKDPRLGFVTVTRVELSADLRYAKVLVSVLGSEEQRRDSLKALRSAAGFLRREIGQRIRMRRVPELDVRHDAGLDATQRVAELLREIGPIPAEDASEPTKGTDDE
jgi:ribosome-binding factor A